MTQFELPKIPIFDFPAYCKYKKEGASTESYLEYLSVKGYTWKKRNFFVFVDEYGNTN